jgi:hypothetical protein
MKSVSWITVWTKKKRKESHAVLLLPRPPFLFCFRWRDRPSSCHHRHHKPRNPFSLLTAAAIQRRWFISVFLLRLVYQSWLHIFSIIIISVWSQLKSILDIFVWPEGESQSLRDLCVRHRFIPLFLLVIFPLGNYIVDIMLCGLAGAGSWFFRPVLRPALFQLRPTTAHYIITFDSHVCCCPFPVVSWMVNQGGTMSTTLLLRHHFLTSIITEQCYISFYF